MDLSLELSSSKGCVSVGDYTVSPCTGVHFTTFLEITCKEGTNITQLCVITALRNTSSHTTSLVNQTSGSRDYHTTIG